ncbi:hypothetical protein BOTCAL_0115g00140 [Botryotinia calthae]|uniref:BTB domain-containing protein n=1 Tax=Botryotinia calthae TaxID=38488 RepID=A0A4Y8D513_9HELO|nr:hypothetical protein BOTCAL_0115g00140 [Botryotinia calthae]
MFNGGFSESTTNSSVLREDSTEVFDVLADWVYTNRLPPEFAFWSFDLAVEVYIFADKTCLTGLMDQVMDKIQARYPLGPAGALRLYSKLPRGSKLLLFALYTTIRSSLLTTRPFRR